MKKFQIESYNSLLDDIANGNQQSFSRLYDLFHPTLIQFVNSKVNDLSSAEDILHDLFLSIWRNREKIQEIEYFPAYLYSSCRYLVIDHIRKSSVWNNTEGLEDLNIEYEEAPLEDRLYFRYLLDMVNKEIENLPEKCREIFKLSRNEFKTNKDIAEALGISESTVENQINKALKRIRIITKNRFVFFMLWY